ncbi:MAG: methylenetetrahydrofolate reductase [Chloroflexi bacterium]|nr:methylenetetrahydrofolate reductase [Chloroflexota bacterium]
MRGLFRRGNALDDRGRAALARVLADPTWELIPLRNARDQAAALPPGSTISVTASPAKGIEATIDLAIELERAGHHVVPHLSARMIRDDHHLTELMARLTDANIDRAFVVGGDEETPGEFADGLSLLEAMDDLGVLPREVGIPCYPQGHPTIPDGALLAALEAKARYATSMTTQLCFDPKAIETWLAGRRAQGISLPVRIGIPGVAEIPKLISISARIGVRDASRFVLKNRRFVAQLLRSGGTYRPTGLLEDLSSLIANPDAKVTGLHVYTFNNVPATVAWRDEELGSLPG